MRAPLLLPLLTLLSVSPLAAAPAPRLGHAVDPTDQAVTLRLDPERKDYSGSVRIALAVHQRVSALRLHAAMPLLSLNISGAAGAVGATHKQQGQEVVVSLAQPLEPGAYTLTADFQQAFGQKAVGLYRVVQDGRGYAFTQFEPADARLAFPCFDEPDFKIPYQLTLEIPPGMEAVSNTPVERDALRGGLRALTFKKTRPLPSYLLAIAVGPLEFAPIPGLSVPGRVVTPRGQRHLAARAVAITPKVLQAMESYFGTPYPYEKLDLIAVPEYWPGAMENPGAITYRDHYLLHDAKTETPEQHQTLVTITAHELAHMWFGDLVTMRWWDDLWLNESFAEWMGTKIASQVAPQYHLDVAAAQEAQDIMQTDARPTTEAIRQATSDPDEALRRVGLHYRKGKAVLGMFERWLGPERFRAGIQAYLRQHRDGNATSADLWAALQAAAGGAAVTQVIASFIDQPGLPLISVEVLPGGQVRLSQQRFHNAGVAVAAQGFRVPVSLKFSDGKVTGQRTVLLEGQSQTVTLTRGELAWVFPHAEAVGYYRWTLPRERLQALAQQAQQALSPAERVALLGDLAALLSAGLLPADELLRALGLLADDPDPQVLSALLGVLGRVHQALVTDELRGAFAGYLQKVLAPARRRFGLSPQPGEDPRVTLLRPELLEWLGARGEDPEVLGLAAQRAQAYLRDASSLDPSTAATWLGLAALRGDRALLTAYQRRFEGAKVPSEREHLLEALGRFQAPPLREEVLRYSVSGALRTHELLGLPFTAAEAPGARPAVFRWMTQSFDALAQRIPASFMPHLVQLASGCEEPLASEAQRFFTQPAHHRPGVDLALAKLQQRVSDCAALRRREGAALARFLRTSAAR